MTDKEPPEHPELLSEGQCGSLESWSARLGVGAAEIARLVSQGLLRKHRSAGSEGNLRLDFVGLLSTRQGAFFALPKVYTDLKRVTREDLRRVLGCLRAYEEKIRRGPPTAMAGAAEFAAGAGNLLDLFLSLHAWSDEHGLHAAETVVPSSDFAHVDWGATMHQTLAAHQRSSIIYVEPRGRRAKMVLSELAEIQALALLDVKNRLGALSQLWLQDHDPLLDECREVVGTSLYRIGDKTAIRESLAGLAFGATRDFDKELLSLLHQWLDEDFYQGERPQLYGTTAFHTVWEDMCLTFLGASAQRHADIASQPRYVSQGMDIMLGPQRPDYLHRQGNYVWIADAKWYRVEKGELPLLADAMKQFVYELSVSESLEVRGNCFILPHLGGPRWRDAGKLSMFKGESSDIRFPEVRLISVDWNAAADAYRLARRATYWGEIFEAAESG